MELIDLKVTFTESTEYNLKNLSRFNEKSLEEKVKNLNDANRRARKTLRGAYDKTDVILILADGTEHRMRFDLGCDSGLLEKASKMLNCPLLIGGDSSPYTFSVEWHYNTEGGMGCEVYAKDLKTFARAEAVLKEACAKDPVDSYWHDTPNFKEWAIIITPKEYKLPVDSED